ncbi:MAG: hypothetical protein IJN93_05920 [Clostridia bacterium]|nr:hypothetical protein [Clostridia bacterium]
MAKRDFEKAEREKAQIIEHFKKQRRKLALIFWPCDIAAVIIAAIVVRVLTDGANFVQWFILALLFVLVFPITMYSKKMTQLKKTEQKQINLAQQDV